MQKPAFMVCFFLLSALTFFLAPLPSAFGARSISAQRECATCHIMWLDQFRQKKIEPLLELKAQPVIIAGKQGVVSTERMCYTCHDGFILDSRFAWKDNKVNFHPIGVTPKRVEIPIRKDGTEAFPLDKNGQVYCGTCHSAHGVSWDTKDSPIFLRENNKDSMMCMICHINRATGPVEGNHPVNKTSIEIPKKIDRLGGKTGAYKNQIICQSCHRVHGAAAKKLLITNNDNSQLCGICHSDRYAKDMGEARQMHTHPVNITSEKVQIDKIVDSGGKKGVGGEIICQSCHKPHYAKRGKGILVKENHDSGLCRTCHTDKESLFVTKHNLQKTAPTTVNARGQTPLQGGPCSACHFPHRGKSARMWARDFVTGEDTISNMCKSCHSEGMPASKKKVESHSHPIFADIDKVGGETTLPLFTAEGNVAEAGGEEKGRVVCASCHNVHQWNPKFPRAGTFEEEGDATNSFLRTAAAPAPDLCVNCHRDKKFIVKTDHDMRVTAPNATNLQGNNVLKSGVCGVCHMIHNSPTKAKIWARQLSGRGDIIAQLCRSCHTQNGPASKKQTGRFTHPTGKSVSNINITIADDGKWSHPYLDAIGKEERVELTPLPFFDREGTKRIRGEISCGSCHDPHRWNPKEAKEGRGKNREGDGTNSFLRIANDPDSTLCKNCHVEKRSIVFSKHNLKLTVPGDKNIMGRTAKKTGICSSCHLPHNGTGPKMWAREPHSKGDYVERLCKSCHEKGKAAKKKQVGAYSHPVGRSIKTLGIDPVSRNVWKATLEEDYVDSAKLLFPLPLYAVTGEKVADGNVSCGSCHDPHQWDPEVYPREALVKTGEISSKLKKFFSKLIRKIRKEEGNGTNSFLRIANAPASNLCKNCHLDKRSVELSKHNLNISADKERNVQGLTPRQSGSCSGCHLPHNGTGPKMWARPLKDQGDDMSKLCKSCHDKAYVARTKPVEDFSHPVYADISKADGKTDFPLYSARAVKTTKELGGRVVCATCHDPHQWDPRDRLSKAGASKKVEGTARDSFLRKPAYPAPELCINCHGSKKYVEFTDHDMTITAPSAKNLSGKTVKETGKCGFCHMVHNSPNNNRIWALSRGPGDDGMETLCRSCHIKDGIAKRKRPKYFNHPIDIKITSTKMRQKGKKGEILPVYGVKGEKSKTGIITCPTCHNPHRWKPNTEEYGAGKNLEGDSNSSFLRSVSDIAFCSDCHGRDGLFRYKYYHGATSRKRGVSITGGMGR